MHHVTMQAVLPAGCILGALEYYKDKCTSVDVTKTCESCLLPHIFKLVLIRNRDGGLRCLFSTAPLS